MNKSKFLLSVCSLVLTLGVLLNVPNKASAAEYYRGDYTQNKDTSFSNYIWIKQGAYFTNLNGVSLESADRKDVRVEFWHEHGYLVHSQVLRFNDQHWNTAVFWGNNWYKIKLVNASGTGTVDLRAVQVS